ncbi:MAG: hypothetical protein ACTHNU_16935, partial [Gaiellales bacterium]
MPDELERDLERALAGLPGPSPEVTERALRSSLDALPEPAPRRRKWRGPVMLGIAAAAVLTAAGVTLAATGTPPFSAQKPERHTPTTVVGPASAHISGTVATFADGRLWLGRTRGRPFSAVELSPGGLYAAVGEPGRLSVYTPDLRRRVWSQRVNGSVVAI